MSLVRHLRAAVAASAVCLLIGGAAIADASAPGPMTLGDAHAPITVIEYASVGCPHCAVWANEVFPNFRRKYIDTGKVRFEFHELLTGNPVLAAAGFLTARCAGPDKYFQVVDDVFAEESQIAAEGRDALERIGARAGLTHDQFATCLRDQAAVTALSSRTIDDAKKHGVTGTPTFFVGDTKLEGEQTLEQLDEAIAHARR